MSEPERVPGPDGNRWYRTEEGDYPSVTTVTGTLPEKKQRINGWEDKERKNGNDPNLIRDRAALRGTLVHHRALNPLAMRPLPLPEVDMTMLDGELKAEIEMCLAMWDDLDLDVGDSPYVEERVVSHEHGYAGTLDLLTGGTVIDLKTSIAIFPSHKMQASAYFLAAREVDRLPDPEDAAIIQLNPKPDSNPTMTPEIVRMDESTVEHWFGKFKSLLAKFDV